MKKICLIKWDMCEKSGADRVAAALASELSNYFDVHLVSICGKGEQSFFEVSDNVKYFPMLKGHNRISKALIPGSIKLHKYVRKNKFDVVMSIAGNVNMFLMLGTLCTSSKRVFCEHYNLGQAMKDKTDTFLRRIAVKKADKIVVLTERSKADYINMLNANEKKIEVIPNWIANELLNRSTEYNADSKRIITAGRFCNQKGFDLLVESASYFFQDHMDWHWDIYGEGEDYEKISRQISDCGLESNIHLMGNVSNMYELYSQYAMYVMTSRHEALPMVLLEAKAHKLPMVSFDCPTGPSEIIRDGWNGLLVEEQNVRQLAEKIAFLADSKEVRIDFSEHAYDNMKAYEIESVMWKWIDFLENQI